MKTRTLVFMIIKVCVDAAMTVLFLLLMGYHLLDGATHEWLGISLFVLFLVHNALNYRWYLSLFKGKYGAVRIIQTVINVLLWVAMICCIVSSMCISAYAFTWTHTNMMMGRKLHLGATVWAFLLMSLHLGFHWSYFIGMAKKIAKPTERVAVILKWVFRAIIFAVCLYAAVIFNARDYLADMSFTVEFKFISEADYAKSVAQYFFESLSIMAMVTTIGYYLKKAITDISVAFKKTIAQGKCKDKKLLANKIHDLVENELQTNGDNISVSVKEIPKETWMSFIKTVPSGEMVVKPKYKIE